MIIFERFSKKQAQVLTWWHPTSPMREKEGIILDGSIRAGKTVPSAIAFVIWAMTMFEFQNFALCGKTVGSFRRNVWFWLRVTLTIRGYQVVNGDPTMNQFIIRNGERENYFYIFGGNHEGSQNLIQGITLAGAFFDEVALMPESFVNQATGRCSVPGSKFWFNCNPDSPAHWFKKLWVDKADEKRLFYLHFTMDDNPSLTDAIRARYASMYVGVFYKRFILGLWAVAQGAIYDMWSEENEYTEIPEAVYRNGERVISIDYGTTNPCVFIDAYDDGDVIYCENEYRWDSKVEGRQKTDSEYADDLMKMIEDGIYPSQIILDPSAASFRAELRARGLVVKDADNEVIDGIRMTATMIAHRKLRINTNNCKRGLEELLGYVWDEKASEHGIERPLKVADHFPDSGRYLIRTRIKPWRLQA